MSIILIILVSAVAGAGYYLGGDLPLSGIWAYFEALRTTSAIVFGVLGALLAIVYPEVIKQGFRPRENGTAADLANITYITNPLAQSAALLIVIVILGPIFAWLAAHYEKNVTVCSVTFALLAVLTLWQVAILVMLLRPLDIMHTHSVVMRTKAERRQRLHSNLNRPE
jgi:hypothetical protein